MCQLQALADMSILAIVGFVKSPLAPAAGIASIIFGVAGTDNSILIPFVSVVGGVGLLILAWFAQSVKRVMERWLDSQGEKLIDLPNREQRDAIERTRSEEKRHLMTTLEEFAHAADGERRESQTFRVQLAGTLADHAARLRNLEGGKKHNTGETLRSGGHVER